MKWTKKAHEFDQVAEELLTMNRYSKYYIFGAGILGKELVDIFREYGCLVFFIDNDIKKQCEKVEDIKVLSLSEYLKKKDGQIIIAASKNNSIEIKKQLEENALIHRKDFFLYDEFVNFFFPVISVYRFNKSFIALAQISLTERCTLKCKKCAHGCAFVSNSAAIDLTLQQVYKSADSFFSKVDFVKEFVLIGGEPLLYKKLASAVEYIGKRYRNQMQLFVITTNGTIIPDDDVLKACKKYNVLFRISNYSLQIPRLKKLYQRLICTMESSGVSYVLEEEEHEWVDYGYEYVNRDILENKLIEVFDTCKTPCREIRENRFYFCVMGKDNKKELLEFTLGYSEKGYLDMCRHCNGAKAKNYPIVAAEQVK